MGPIVQDLHPKFDFRYAYKFEELNIDDIQNKIATIEEDLKKLSQIKVSISRNFRGMPFTPLMTKEHKL